MTQDNHNETPLQRALRAGIDKGVLPPDATLTPRTGRPWPVVLLTALGAWLATLPMLGVVGMLLGDIISKSAGAYLVGALVLAAAVTVLRSRDLPVFVEQLAVPGLLLGGGTLAFGLFRDLSEQAAAGTLLLIALGLAAAIDRPWLRTLLGAAAAGLCVMLLLPGRLFHQGADTMLSFWLALHGALLAWLLAMLVQRHGLGHGEGARVASVVESTAAGWLLATLAGLAWWAGMSFLVGGSMGAGVLGSIVQDLGVRKEPGSGVTFLRACSLVLAAAAVLRAGRAWPVLRQPATAAVGLVLAGLSWFLPSLGAVLLALSWTATSQRWRLATAAAVAAAWIVGSFYYQLQWPLAQKASLLVAAGAVLGAIAWLAGRGKAGVTPVHPPARHGRGAALMLLGAVLALGLANFSIWQKETLIASGQKVFVALAPVDPRSLMQGDFMRLNYALPGAMDDELRDLVTLQRPHVIARRDERGVAQLLRIAKADTPLGAGEMRIELTPKDGRWILVSDGWFFREGDARRWEAAKYGEFRVTPEGKALLVGLADAQLQAIPVQP